jgi:hypothetical protein
MSDLSGLHGVYPTSLRWDAESGFLAVSVFNPETGERELQEIELGKPATFAIDLATRERGYGLIKTGVYNMQLTPVGSPPPSWPDDEEYKPAIGMWAWNPSLGEVRVETNASIFRAAIADVWDRARSKPEASDGAQPVIRFTDRVKIPIKQVNKSFFGPVIQIVGWCQRDQVPGWSTREPTVAPPKALPVSPASSTTPAAKKSAKAKRGAPKPESDDPPLDDEIPW